MRRLIGWILTAFVPAAIAAPFPARGYYAGLRKPSWSPPGWLFGPVWTVLYAAMGIAAWLVGERGGREARPALVLWFGQLLLNAAWTPVFFGLRAPGAALATITALWVAIVATTIAFVRRRPAAGVLLLPYLAWVTFAGLLNLEIWRRNR